MDFWHLMNRGVDKRQIVASDKDRLRFVKNLIVMNDARHVENFTYSLAQAKHNSIDIGYRYAKRKRLVTIHAWCLMGNHYHLLLEENIKNGIDLFLRKLNGGYSRYFNKRNERAGALFQGKTKRVLIENDRQFLYILPYIHLNPLDLLKGGAVWRTQCLVDSARALKWITDYRWSSYRNYAGEQEFVEILEGSELFSEKQTHVCELERFLKDMPDPTLSALNLE